MTWTDVHGANRLASTSLLEGLVWGYRVAEHDEAQFQVGELAPMPGCQEVLPGMKAALQPSPILP